MFMTFIAISILSAVFITMYLYLLRTQTLATEAQRLYAEAAQEKLEVILDKDHNRVNITNTGGIGVVVKYLALLKEKDALIEGPIDLTIPPGGNLSISLPTTWTSILNGHHILVLTERGNRFMAELPTLMEKNLLMTLDDSSLSLFQGGSVSTTLRIKAPQNYPKWQIKLVADFSNCTMENSLTGFSCNCFYIWWMGSWVCICPEETSPLTYQYKFIDKVTFDKSLITITPGTEEKVTVTIYAKDINPWTSGTTCYVWVKALNATTGTLLADAGLQIITE